MRSLSVHLSQERLLEMKARQGVKIRAIHDALDRAGFRTLNEQARILAVCRSTAYTIKQAAHKGSGLSSKVVKRLFAAPALPDAVRELVLEYVSEKLAGAYGHSQTSLRRFAANLLSPSIGLRACDSSHE
jgi:hypothetical protein